MKKLYLVVILCSMTVFALPTSAAVLSNTAWTVGDFLAATPIYVAGKTSTFDFDPPTTPFDGSVESLVYTNASKTLFGYAYRIQVIPGSSDAVNALSVDFWRLVDSFSFYLTNGGGSKAPTSASISSAEVLTFGFLGDSLLPGEASFWFGAFSTLPPGTRIANLLDAGGEASPAVLAPVPEPGMIILLGSGLVGLAGWGRKKFRK